MKQSQLYNILKNLSECSEIIQYALDELDGESTDDTITLLNHLYDSRIIVSDMVNGDVDLPKDHKPIETRSGVEGDALEDAYDVLKHESKPGPTLLVKELNISKKDAKSLFDKLVDTGRIVKGQRAEEPEPTKDKPKKTTKKKTSKKKATKKKESDVMELINELPDGDDLLVPKHLHSLIALPEEVRAMYLSGLNLKDLITTDDIARASVNGVNTILVDQINELSGTKDVKPKDDELIKISKTGNKQAQKYYKLRAKFVSQIPQGKELYKHMARNGVTLRVLTDLREIAKVSSEGKL